MKILSITTLLGLFATHTLSLTVSRQSTHIQKSNNHNNSIQPKSLTEIKKHQNIIQKEHQFTDQQSIEDSQSQQIQNFFMKSKNEFHKISDLKNYRGIPHRG